MTTMRSTAEVTQFSVTDAGEPLYGVAFHRPDGVWTVLAESGDRSVVQQIADAHNRGDITLEYEGNGGIATQPKSVKADDLEIGTTYAIVFNGSREDDHDEAEYLGQLPYDGDARWHLFYLFDEERVLGLSPTEIEMDGVVR